MTPRHAAPDTIRRDIHTNPFAHRVAWVAMHGPLPKPHSHRYVTTVAVAS